jgi:asparagine synthase (glutamine-hydrolysing)
MLEGVHKLGQGSALVYDVTRDAARSWQYWKLPQPADQESTSAEDLVDELEELLQDSVKRQLMADVPVGILLSGGVDSSLVTAMAARLTSSRVKTFTVVFPEHPSFNEAPFARLVANHFGTDHTELEAPEGSADLLPELARQYDEPLADSSMVPTYLVSRLIRRHATVALGGDGGDELFGGYPHHRLLQKKARWQHIVPQSVQNAIGAAASSLMPVGVRGRHYLTTFSASPRQSISQVGLFFDQANRKQLLSPLVRSGLSLGRSPEDFKNAGFQNSGSFLKQVTASDFTTYLVDDILVKVDRASMLTSLEVRAPFLDYRIIEFAYGRVPDHLRATHRELKILPRRLSKRVLPPSLKLNRKRGFSLPMGALFKTDWGPFMIGVLNEADANLFDRTAIANLIASQQRGLVNGHRLFALTMFELWRNHYKVGLPDKIAIDAAMI